VVSKELRWCEKWYGWGSSTLKSTRLTPDLFFNVGFTLKSLSKGWKTNSSACKAKKVGWKQDPSCFGRPASVVLIHQVKTSHLPSGNYLGDRGVNPHSLIFPSLRKHFLLGGPDGERPSDNA